MGSPIGKRASLVIPVAVGWGVIRSAPSASIARWAVPPLARWIALTVVAGTLLAVLGPFGSYMNGGAMRLLAYWIGAMLLGLVLYGSAYRMAGIWTVPGSWRWWLTLVVAALVASVPETLATRAAAFRIWPELSNVYLPLPLWFAQTATIGLIATMGIGFFRRRPVSAPIDASAAPPVIEPVVTPLGGDVLALQMEDHYVRIHRPAGTELILMPLGRAIKAVQVQGLRTHRSWWVASHAVERVEGNARSMRLILSNGAVAPVARSAVIHLRDKGWFSNASSDINPDASS
ncbi:hypothetical protein QE361_003491 [Sphingomonas sp. SORGH_AS802]|uniref:LytTR family DNA-binding domain-containing protein n=1 Tax=unclassified Sphingomonas TaxID=196159 RepID=UPI00285DBB2D|nr:MULTISPECIES: LytTR family DNA-binding domain-containing protein [unclassified Sphingomonas]MDR6129054.1 hypothetical protein [Sphingomonas sp. SORGH_AS_0438]MDR6136484.1 hypothetical protein [Sphingomonas sp. SORGH_AS_0802]